MAVGEIDPHISHIQSIDFDQSLQQTNFYTLSGKYAVLLKSKVASKGNIHQVTPPLQQNQPQNFTASIIAEVYNATRFHKNHLSTFCAVMLMDRHKEATTHTHISDYITSLAEVIRHLRHSTVLTYSNSFEVSGCLQETESMLQSHDAFSALMQTYKQTSLCQLRTPVCIQTTYQTKPSHNHQVLSMVKINSKCFMLH